MSVMSRGCLCPLCLEGVYVRFHMRCLYYQWSRLLNIPLYYQWSAFVYIYSAVFVAQRD